MNPSILLPNFRNAPLIRNNFNWVLKNLDSSVQRTTFLAPIKNQNIAHMGGAKRGKIPAYDWLKKWREYFSYRRSKKWREQNDCDLTTENTHMKLPCDSYTKNNPPKTCTHSPDVSGSDWSIASFLVPCQLTRFSRPVELCSPGFLSCSFLGTCALYQYLLSSIRSRISVASGWTRSPQVSQSGWITKSINTTWGRRNTGGL